MIANSLSCVVDVDSVNSIVLIYVEIKTLKNTLDWESLLPLVIYYLLSLVDTTYGLYNFLETNK